MQDLVERIIGLDRERLVGGVRFRVCELESVGPTGRSSDQSPTSPGSGWRSETSLCRRGERWGFETWNVPNSLTARTLVLVPWSNCVVVSVPSHVAVWEKTDCPGAIVTEVGG